MVLSSCTQNSKTKDSDIAPFEKPYDEQYRPQYHFSPFSAWMNDPNGLVYNDGVYHLFYQYYPYATVWGPMHWGHATSNDMLHWQHKPIALYPDENGLIFSGSAVVDKNNTSGFGKDGIAPLVAIYTYHLMEGEKSGSNDFQTQGIAYSLDNGETFTKYEENPVIGNEGIRDLRDPKVFWHDDTKSWIMALVAGDHLKLYRSKNLKQWDIISDFGEDQGAQGGVWECPDLFEMQVEGTDEKKWVLIISIGSGGPNGGSATQYFVGDFDGTTFTSNQEKIKWLDWGTDNYAGVTYNNTPDNERLFIGWMSNWQYALKTPTKKWRSAMTLPRTLQLKKYGDEYMLHNSPVSKIDTLIQPSETKGFTIEPNESQKVTAQNLNQAKIAFTATKKDFKMSLSNKKDERLTLIYDDASDLLMLDRTQSGATSFNYEFGNKLHHMVTDQLKGEDFKVEIYMDWSSIEIFINDGQYVMTQQIFPTEVYTDLVFENLSDSNLDIREFSISTIKSVWQ